MKLFSKACEYGIRSVLHVSARPGDEEYVPVREVAENLDISVSFLAKIVGILTEDGILKSYRGPKGGIALAAPADQITLMDIVKAIDGDALFTECLLGLPGCGARNPCPLHDWWGSTREAITKTMGSTTVADLLEDIKQRKVRLIA